MKRIRWVLVVPVLVVLIASMAPLITGSETLFLRDVFNTHLEKKWVQSEAMRAGQIPLIDPLRDGGQPHLGNPNTVALYPDNVLYLLAPFFWAFNAHFWLHLLVAPFTGYWMCRSWGLGRQASWVAGVCFASSGFFLSTMNLFNLIAGVAWTPALVASFLDLAGKRKPAAAIATTSLIWALILLAGDPMIALMALGTACCALLFQAGPRRMPWIGLLASISLGTLIAAPQLIEFLRILPLSFRGHQGFSVGGATAASWNPVTIGEWFIPFMFGKPDLTFWGQRFFGGDPPLFPSLFPGVLTFLLVASSGRCGRPGSRWAWAMVGAGLFFSLGRYNPVVGWILGIPGLDLLRLPIKFWLWVAVGSTLLCGVGYQRIIENRSRKAVALCWIGLTITYTSFWIVLSVAPQLVSSWLPVDSGSAASLADFERLRWAGLCLISLVGLMLYLVIWKIGRSRTLTMSALLVTLHTAIQLFLLRPMVPTDDVRQYVSIPPILSAISKDEIVVHGKSNSLFGAVTIPIDAYPDPSLKWLQRQIFAEAYPVAGSLFGRRYDFSISAEGLDSFLTRAAAQSLGQLSDLARVRLLAASGVDTLLIGRELDKQVGDEATLIDRRETPGGEILAYRLTNAVDEAIFVGNILRAPHLNAALGWITSEKFDPATTAVLPPGSEPVSGRRGVAEVVSATTESLVVKVEAPDPGVLVIQRAFLPIYRARVDGRSASIVAANMHRLGIELQAGNHLVEVWVDRTPFKIGGFVSLLGLIGAAVLLWRSR